MTEEMVIVRMFNNELEASVARAELAATGIQAIVLADAGGGDFPTLQFANSVHLAVHRRDADKAEAVLSARGPGMDV